MSAPRKPKLTTRRRQLIATALEQAAAAQIDFWDSLGELEGAVGFDFGMDNAELSTYADVDSFVQAAWEARDR